MKNFWISCFLIKQCDFNCMQGQNGVDAGKNYKHLQIATISFCYCSAIVESVEFVIF